MRAIGLAAVLAWSTASPALAETSPPAPPRGALAYGCGTPEQVEAGALARLTEEVPDPGERQAQLEVARVAIGKVAELRRDVMSGKTVEAPYSGASQFAVWSARASTPELAELFQRTARDQFGRYHLSVALQRTNWAAGLSDPARAYAFYVMTSDSCDVDEGNTAWLKEQVSRNGWFTVSKYGTEADMAAFLLVQHADRDVAFQAEVLKLLEPLAAAKETNPQTFAYLYDRVAVNTQRPQRWGTQGRCNEAGVWEPREVEAPEQLDERRAAVGLPPEAEYAARFTC